MFTNDLAKAYTEKRYDPYFEKLEEIKSYMIEDAQILSNRRMRSRVTQNTITINPISTKPILKILQIPKMIENPNQIFNTINMITKEIEVGK